MGACGCGQVDNNDIPSFWYRLELRKITFEAYCKIFEENQLNWFSSSDKNNNVDLTKCAELNKLLDNPDFSESKRNLYFKKLNIFVNKQHDKLSFFTCLSFFTKLNEDENKPKKKFDKNSYYLESLSISERSKKIDLVSDALLNMAIKKNNHDEVTMLFLELVTEFPQPLFTLDKKEKEENLSVYSRVAREQLFSQINKYKKQKFYEYMFNKENIFIIHNDLIKINYSSSSKMVSEVNAYADITARKRFSLI